MLGFNVGRNLLHRPRAVQCHDGRDFRESARFQFPDVAAHAGAFQLKNTRRIPRCQQLISLRVIQWDCMQVDIDVVPFFDNLLGFP